MSYDHGDTREAVLNDLREQLAAERALLAKARYSVHLHAQHDGCRNCTELLAQIDAHRDTEHSETRG